MATTTTATPPSILDDIKRRSGWGLFMGILTMALGAVLIIYPFATATVTTVFLGSMLIVVGAAELVLGFSSLSPRGFFAQVFLAILYGFTGAVLLVYPFEGVASLTLFVGAMFVLRGVLAVIAGFRWKPLDGWGWFIADGIGSLAAGGFIIARWPSSSSWAVGTLVGASVLITGVARTAFAARVRQGASDIQRSVRVTP
ncbi:MAG TPA: HdeD family acid-resistance protein [Myxococcaceae bacterium]|nr:HdeD family acid-resistance protein [Myxococcaceae bacterium]